MPKLALPKRILPLPPQVANQIAAGEVIESPAHVLKELVENSLDAGSRSIHCEIAGGGIAQIAVQDDGCGVHPEDFAWALSAHATSKLCHVDDLIEVPTLGFRGEALACIASVAEVQLTSRQADAVHGYQVAADSGVLGALHRTECAVGTSVVVKRLFHTMQARRRFLGSIAKETWHLQQLFCQLAMSHLSVQWSLAVDGAIQWHLPACPDPDSGVYRLKLLWGKRAVQDLHAIDAEVPVWCDSGQSPSKWRLKGWLGSARSARSDRQQQLCILNGRVVRDPVLQKIVRIAYERYLPPGRYPVYALYIQSPLDAYDVNVHPTKHAVRFLSPRLVQDALIPCLQELLEGHPGHQRTVFSDTETGWDEMGAVSVSPLIQDAAGSFSAKQWSLHAWDGRYYLVDHHAFSAMLAYENWQANSSAAQEPLSWCWPDSVMLRHKKRLLAQKSVWSSLQLHWEMDCPVEKQRVAAHVGANSDACALERVVRLQTTHPLWQVFEKPDWEQLLDQLVEVPLLTVQTLLSRVCCGYPLSALPEIDATARRFGGARCLHGRYAIVELPVDFLANVVRKGGVSC